MTFMSPFAIDASLTRLSTKCDSYAAAANGSSGASSGKMSSSSSSSSLCECDPFLLYRFSKGSTPALPLLFGTSTRVFAVPYLLLKCVSRRFRAVIIAANSPAIVDVEWPLYTASPCFEAAKVDSCTRTSAPIASGAMPTLSHVSPSKHSLLPGRSGPTTSVGWIHSPDGVCTDSPFLSRW